MEVDAEARTERRREQSAARCGAHERERVEVDLYRPRRRTLVDHDVDAVVLHRRVEILLYDRRETVNLVNEQHVARFERSEDASEVARLVEHRSARNLEAHAQFVGYNVAKRCLAQSWGAVQQRVVERFAAVLRRLDEHFEVLHHLLLSAEIAEPQRSQSVLKVLLALASLLLTYVEIFFHVVSDNLICTKLVYFWQKKRHTLG